MPIFCILYLNSTFPSLAAYILNWMIGSLGNKEVKYLQEIQKYVLYIQALILPSLCHCNINRPCLH